MLQPTRLGTAELLPPDATERYHPFTDGGFWLGRSPFGPTGQISQDGNPLGISDSRHVLVVGGTRGGKGTGFIVPNLCLWPGSVVCVDPKGENAMLTADARAEGRNGHPQDVFVLDPFEIAQLDNESLRAAFNPLWELMEHDPDGEDHGTPEDDDYEPAMRPVEGAVDETAIIASAIVVDGDGKPGQSEFWHGSARRMIGALILHVISNPRFRGRRNLVTVRQLVMRGDEQLKQLLEDQGKTVPSAQLLMWNDIALSEAFDGVLGEDGAFFAEICGNDPEQFSGILGTAAFHTEFLKSPQLRRTLKRSSFGLDDLKGNPRGISLYFCLPQRYMSAEHYRWLRMMIGLTTQVMEKNPDDPASGHEVLMVLDEFTALRRMSYLEEAVTQYAGHGLKMFFVVQTLDRLKKVYPDGWETFVSQSGIKIFFNADDNFTREYVSKLVGETEIVIRQQGRQATKTLTGGWTETDTETHSLGGGTSESAGEALQLGTSTSWNKGQGGSRNKSEGWGTSITNSFNENWSTSVGESESQSRSKTRTASLSFLFGTLWDPKMTISNSQTQTRSLTETKGGGTSDSYGKSWNGSTSTGENWSDSQGGGESESRSKNSGRARSTSYSDGTSHARGTSGGESEAAGQSEQEQWHRRPIFLPEEVGRFFSGQDANTKNNLWPGLALVLIGGDRTMIVRRVLYYEDPRFAGLFNAHRKHPLKALPALPMPEEDADAEDPWNDEERWRRTQRWRKLKTVAWSLAGVLFMAGLIVLKTEYDLPLADLITGLLFPLFVLSCIVAFGRKHRPDVMHHPGKANDWIAGYAIFSLGVVCILARFGRPWWGLVALILLTIPGRQIANAILNAIDEPAAIRAVADKAQRDA
jgi:type IV secretory pathway TraG/TraD family ATPase VirD4